MPSPKTQKVVILAAGLGSRMRRAGQGPALTSAQAVAAEQGLKALIPTGRPFLDYLLSNVAAAGYRRVCLVVGPQHDQVRSYYEGLRLERLSLEYAIQREPLGTAHALLAAEAFAGTDPLLVLNGDNLYPVAILKQLRDIEGPALAGFERTSLVAHTNIGPERIGAFAVLRGDADGFLEEIIEKPDPGVLRSLPDPVLVSMNCWRFTSDIFAACRQIDRSPRGEFELPDGVMRLVRQEGVRFRVVPSTEGVLDLTCREDIESVTQRLRRVPVQL